MEETTLHSPRRNFCVSFLLSCVAFLSARVAKALEIVSRSDWRAKDPAGQMKRHNPMRITIHHSATKRRPSVPLDQKLRSLQAFSQSEGLLADGRQKKPWADVPYHFYIDANGVVAEGRPVAFAGDTNTNYDPTGHIGIAVEGNFENEVPSTSQLDALVELIQLLLDEYDLEPDAIDHHGSFAATACPGRNLATYLPELKSRVSGYNGKPERGLKLPKPEKRPTSQDSR